ncbi:hypothetical protein DFQ09_101132 [Winogradskyella pacifica]|uniref:Cysteine-rich CPXCG n=2 Tax=Winogradskyella pacifica TaxID=664642 RepID=A0A3D9N567_9FLAO|nr:hypothetical protein DFQ09_101132 [Winogradskyella pacifica]
MLIDLSQSRQSYIEDCEICCNPIQLSIDINNQEIVSFQYENIEQ